MKKEDFVQQVVQSLNKPDRERFMREVIAYEQAIQDQVNSAERQRFLQQAARAQRVPPVLPPMPLSMPNFVSGFGVGSIFEEPPAKPKIDETKIAALKAAEPHRVTPSMPDRIEVITAWRAWGITHKKEKWRLKALGKNHIWKPKKQVNAICAGSGNHPAPQMNCQCGVWAFKDIDILLAALEKYSEVKVLGTVSLWGRVVETENGYRAQYAYPSELWLLDDSLEELGLIYDVPVRTA